MQKLVFILLFICGNIACRAQVFTPAQYVEMYKDLAIKEMKRMGIPAAITLAQGILESESGNSELVKKSNNHFGIKCKSSWTGSSVFHDDDLSGECFRKYDKAEDSYRDHSNFLRGNQRYSALFKLDVTDYKGWAFGLKRAGYATNPSYPQILIKNIEQYNLQQYTLQGAADVPVFDAGKYEDDSVAAPAPVTATVPSKEDDDNSVLDHPDMVLTINKSKCVFVKKGTSLLVIATKNNININKLLEYNELAEDGILGKNQYVYLQKKSKTGDKDFYIVQEGETIYDIAQKNGIQLQYLLDYNKLNSGDVIAAGRKLLLRPGPVQNTGTETMGKIHIVKAKEGLYAIAKKYGVTMQQLREWNDLKSDDLRIGQEIIVSK